MKIRELISVILTVGGLAAVAVLPFQYEKHRSASTATERTVTLTGYAPTGIWTADEVTGANYWKGGFKPYLLQLKKGESVRLILRSADVVHRFYLPELGVGPIVLVPGHTEEVHIKADHEGTYTYYCTAMCGECHFPMKGVVYVGEGIAPEDAHSLCDYLHPAVEPPGLGIVDRGRFWFQSKGCYNCHGEEGKGGIVNFNYAKGTVPALNTLADRMFLSSKDDVEAFTKVLDQPGDVSKTSPAPALSNWSLVSAQYQAVTKTIQGGSPAAKADPALPDPPLSMPSWKEKLNQGQINSIVAYLISLQKFEEHTGWGN